MPQRGDNLPGFREAQLNFAAHIRNPDVHPRPADIDPKRMQVYLELFYNNIEGFLASGFPIAKRILESTRWHSLVRQFVHTHPSESPYFLEVSQEFLSFLGGLQAGVIPEYLLELCHYEWVELALSVDETELPSTGFNADGDLVSGCVLVSPLIWCLAYRWPVHQIGPSHIPDIAPAQSTELIVYRRRDDRVRFMAVNAVTLRLVELLKTAPSGGEALRLLAEELKALSSKVVYEQGIATMHRLREAEILLGSKDIG